MPVFGEHLRRYYPGLTPAEERVWRGFLREHEGDFRTFEYDVRVGEGITPKRDPDAPDPEQHDKMREMYRQLTQKRIDVLALREEDWWIIEVEERASFRAVGQLVGYAHLVGATRPEVISPTLAVVARYIGPDDLTVFESSGILVFKVELSRV